MSIALDLARPETFPSRRDEDWKYTDVRRYLRAAPEPSPRASAAPGGPFADLGGDELLFVNGRCDGTPRLTADGPGEHLARLRFVSAASTPSTASRSPSPASGGEYGHQAEVEIEVAAGSALTLLESHEGAAGGYVSNVRLRISLGAHARLERIILAEDAEDALAFSRAEVRLEAEAAFSQTVLTTGARLQRLETRVRHPGEGAAVRMDGAYLLAGSRHADLTSEVDHVGPDGLTDQLAKGVVRDSARGVFQGRIVVRQGADGTDARMGHHALITSERGEVDAKPELEIYADEVSCAHGNTVGALDEQALFYMQQRGIPAETARAMLTEAFLMEVVDRIGHEGARDVARAWLSERLSDPPPSQGDGGGGPAKLVEGAATGTAPLQADSAPSRAPSTATRSPSPASGGGS